MNNRANLPDVAPRRGPLWYFKWLLACYAAAFALFLLALVASIPFSSVAFADWWFKPAGSLTMLATAIAVSPFIYKRLR